MVTVLWSVNGTGNSMVIAIPYLELKKVGIEIA
jgi:hypothetical protein